jgi:hypothetical protein
VKAFDGYIFILPDGRRGHGADPDRLRLAAALQAWDGWLVGCRDRHPANGAARLRRRAAAVTLLGTIGAPAGTLATALAAAGEREGCDYILSVIDYERRA